MIIFSANNLATALSNKYTSEEEVKAKTHFKYLLNYLGSNGIDAKCFTIEEEYTSRDYLHDYAAYYALCFEKYPKRCKRIHFFNNNFTEEIFTQNIVSANPVSQNFWDCYLGFIVVKPIPKTLIGTTILKTYPKTNTGGNRLFWGTREYAVHIFGKEVKLKSLAFQEQDQVLSACATTAIWTMLHKAALDITTVLKSPGQITKDAGNTSLDGSRLFPNKGLDALQICNAIYNSGLVSEVRSANKIWQMPGFPSTSKKVLSSNYLRKLVRAYSSVGIPLILIIEVPNGNSYGLHAVTVTGYFEDDQYTFSNLGDLNWESNKVSKIYAHDDQWGPNVKFILNHDNTLSGPWSENHNERNPIFATSLIIPLFPKIRIRYETILALTYGLDFIVGKILGNKINGSIHWDVRLLYSEEYKKSINCSGLSAVTKLNFLKRSLPKYLWVVNCKIDDKILFDFVFDATGIKNAMIGLEVLPYFTGEALKYVIAFLTANQKSWKMLVNKTTQGNYYEFVVNQLEKHLAE